MKLTRNGLNFFVNCPTITFDDKDIQEFGVTDKDLRGLMDEGYINYDEDTDQYFWEGHEREGRE